MRHNLATPLAAKRSHTDSVTEFIDKQNSRHEELMRHAYKSHPAPSCIKDVEFRILGCNRAFETLHGIREAEIIGKTSTDFLGEAGQVDLSTDRKALLNIDELVHETAIVDSKLHLREFEVRKAPICDPETGATIGLFCVYTDHTTQNKTDRELSRVRVVMDSSQDCFLVIDRDEMRIIDCNKYASEALQYSRQEILDLNPCSILPQVQETKLRSLFEDYENDKRGGAIFDTLVMRQDGSVFESEVQINPVSESIEDLFVLGIRDISNRKQSEKELKRANDTLRLLGSINKILINASDENELMMQICDEIVKAASFSAVFAIVGSRKKAGFSSIYKDSLSNLDIAECLREMELGETEISQILGLESTEPLALHAQARMEAIPGCLPKWSMPRFGSALCLPTECDTPSKVALVIFAKESNVFDESEIKLIKELQDEIVYGVQSLYQHQAKYDAEQKISKQLAIESAIAKFSRSLLSSDSLDAGIRGALPSLLIASEATQIFLYNVDHGDSDQTVATLFCEFAKSEMERTPAAPSEIPMQQSLPRWLRLLSKRRGIDSKTASLSKEERDLFHFDCNARILIYPLFANSVWIGFLGINIPGKGIEDVAVSREMLAMATDLLADLFARRDTDAHMKMLAQAINSSDEGVIISSADETFVDSKIVFANDGLCRMSGYAKNQIIGKPASFIQAKELSKESLETLLADLSEGNAHISEIIATRNDKSSISCERRIYPITDERGKLASYLCVLRDITEHKKLESRVSFVNKMESIGQLSAGIAHEINTPSQFIGDNLSFFSGSWEKLEPLLIGLSENERLEEVVERYDLPPLSSKLLKRILANIPEAISDANEGVERVSTIVKAMREFSHPEKRTKLADINKCIETTVTVARNEWKYISELTTELDESLPLVECMPGDINQVILNLIVNACQAIAERIGDSKDRGQIHIRSHLHENDLRISISDTGNGIPKEIRKSIFDPFFTTKEVGKGTGQGLFMVHSIIEQNHGGKVGFESEIGVGTTFHIDLPLPKSKPNRDAIR